jgi:cold shock CspA family protein
MSSADETSVDVQSERLLGQVKWFNNKAGYGFITVNEGEHSGKDIFIHYSTIRTTNSQYKYLVQGEYVEFNLVKSTTDNHEYQAVDISGIKGGPLMCETRRVNRVISNDSSSEQRPPRRQYKSTDDSRLSRPSNEDGEYQVVQKRRSAPSNRGPRLPRGPAVKKEQNAVE